MAEVQFSLPFLFPFPHILPQEPQVGIGFAPTSLPEQGSCLGNPTPLGRWLGRGRDLQQRRKGRWKLPGPTWATSVGSRQLRAGHHAGKRSRTQDTMPARGAGPQPSPVRGWAFQAGRSPTWVASLAGPGEELWCLVSYTASEGG